MSDRLPLTGAQLGAWYGCTLQPGPQWVVAEHLEIQGPLRPQLLVQAIHAVLPGVEALAVRFEEDADGTPWQCRIPLALPEVPVHDLRDADDPRAAVQVLMEQARLRPLDPTRDPLWDSAVFQVGNEEWLWWQRFHHIALDHLGASLLTRRVADAYAALADGGQPQVGDLPPLSAVVEEELAYLASARVAVDREALVGAGQDALPAPSLTPGTAPAGGAALRAAATVSGEQVDALQKAAADAGASWPQLVATAVAVLVARTSGQSEVVLSWPLAARLGSVARRTPTMSVNVLPLRLSVRDDISVHDLVAQAGERMRGLGKHGRYRYEQLRRDLRLATGERLFGPQVNVLPDTLDVRIEGSPLRLHNTNAGPVEDVTLTVRQQGRDALRVEVDANPALYSQAETAAVLQRFLHLLDQVARGLSLDTLLGDLDALPAVERELVLRGWNDTAHPVPAATLDELVRDALRRHPEAVAVVEDATAKTLSCNKFDERVELLARALVHEGAAPGVVVAVELPRSLDLVVALHAVVRAGAAYLPIDPSLPVERREFMVEDAGARIVLTADSLARRESAGLRAQRSVRPQPADPAYVIYTSGSTGRPKGVTVPHEGIVNRLLWMQDAYPLGADDVVVQKTPAGFDVSVWEFFWPFIAGARLVVAKPDGHRDPDYLAELIRRHGVTTAHFVPSMLEVFLAEPAAPSSVGSLRRVFCSGEALPEPVVRTAHRLLPAVEMHNLYGPTEASVDVTAWHCRLSDPPGPVPIGRPVWNTRTYVLDAALRPVPVGAPGELYLAGVQVALGYVNRPELTAERFLADPFVPGERMYRTGDVARWRADGALDYLGRNDDQVKIRGQRVEPGEVAEVLLRDPSVAQAVVVPVEDPPGAVRLVAYVVPAPGVSFDLSALHGVLVASLPEHMVPSVVVPIAEMPLSSNGKLDRKALPAPPGVAREVAVADDPLVARVAALFAELLGLDVVGPDESFFELGGNSLLAARLAARARGVLELPVSVATVFSAPTPAALSRAVPGEAARPVVVLRNAVGEPLFCLPPAGGFSWCYTTLLPHLPATTPLLGLQSPAVCGGPSPATLEELAEHYASLVVERAGRGRVHLLGWSVGGVLAQAVAVRLRDRGIEVGLVALLDAYPGEQWSAIPAPGEAEARAAVRRMATEDAAAVPLAALEPAVLEVVVDSVVSSAGMMRTHRTRAYDGELLLVVAGERPEQPLFDLPADRLDPLGWTEHCAALRTLTVPVTHPQLLRAAALDVVGPALADALATAHRPGPVLADTTKENIA